MGVAKARSHQYLVNNAFPGTGRPHTKFFAGLVSDLLFSAKITSCGCGYEKTIPIIMLMCLIMLTRVFGEYMPNFGIFSQNV